MATIVYLDVEDEITSAATRIRGAGESRVALVLPFGSRLATSRINFRLLAREAMVNGRRLDIVAPDASARALAASAGLPVFASIGEYEAALERPADETNGTQGPAPETAALATGAASATATGSSGRRERAGAPSGKAREVVEPTAPLDEEPTARPRGEPQVVRASGRRRLGAGAVAGLGLLVLAVAVAGAAGYVFLPSADITVTPRVETIGPLPLTVRADPAATTVDADSGVIPAQTLSIPVESSGEFPATGKRVEETTATGGVRWTNCDPTAAYTIPRGTVVKTSSGIGFTTDEQVFLPVATLSGVPPNVKVDCQTSEVSVTAVKAGPDGNVDAGAIRVVPARYNRTVIRVTNPAATTGGKRNEFPKVSQKDVDAAITQLRKDIEARFATALEDPANAPEGATVFPDTRTLGEASPDVDPATLVNQEVESFKLRMTATGSVLAVDSSPVKAIAENRLQASVDNGYRLVDGSIAVTVGDGEVVGGVVTFPVQGSARQVRTLDAATLKRQVMGLGAQEARDLLSQYGDVQLTLWPDWVSSVPGLEQRVTLNVATPPDATPSASPSQVPSGGASAEPSAAPGEGASGSEPVPSE